MRIMLTGGREQYTTEESCPKCGSSQPVIFESTPPIIINPRRIIKAAAAVFWTITVLGACLTFGVGDWLLFQDTAYCYFNPQNTQCIPWQAAIVLDLLINTIVCSAVAVMLSSMVGE